MKFFKTLSTILGVGAVLFGLTHYQVLTIKDAVALSIMVLIIQICFGVELEPIKYKLSELWNGTAEIQKHLKKSKEFDPMHLINPDDGFVKLRSPLDLTDLGIRLLEQSGGKTTIDNIYETLEGMIRIKSPKTAYDVQEYAGQIVADLKDVDFMSSIKAFVYSHPVFDGNKLELSDIQRVMIIYLRNKYLENHPGLVKENKENNK